MTAKHPNGSLEPDFWLMLERSDLAGALPELNVMAVNELLCLFRSFHIVGAFERNRRQIELGHPLWQIGTFGCPTV